MSIRSILNWLLILAYIAFTVSQHENVQAFLGPIADRMGRPLFYSIFGVSAVLLSLFACYTFWLSSAASAARNSLRRHWAVALLATFASFSLLTVNNAELVHYPQYFILSMLLFPYLRSVGETVAWSTLVGLLDEGYQYFVIHPDWGVPWDFNDVVLDICGGWLGALWIASRWKATPLANPLWWRKSGLLTFFTSVATLPLLVGLGKVQLYENKNYVGWWFALSRKRHNDFWFFDETWGPRKIHLLTPTEGPIFMLAFVLIASAIDRRYQFTK